MEFQEELEMKNYQESKISSNSREFVRGRRRIQPIVSEETE